MERVVYIDECGFNVNIHRKYGRSLRGRRCFIETAGNRGGNLSILGFLSPVHGFYSRHHLGAYNRNSLCEDLRHFFEYPARNKRNLLIIMDNAPIHRSLIVRNLIVEYGHSLLFLPPYSPMLNPIEECFSQLKNGVRSKLCTYNRNRNSLIGAIRMSVGDITINNCNAYYQHMLQYLVPSLNKHNIYV